MPAMTTPTAMGRKALLQSISSNQAKIVAVYTPVIGNGIATKKSSAQKPYLSTLALPLVLKLLRYLSNNGIRVRNLSYSKGKMKNMGKNISVLTTTAIRKTDQGSSPKYIPNGIPPLNSLMGETVTSRNLVMSHMSNVILFFRNSAAYDRKA